MKLNLPIVTSFLFCHKIQQDVLSKNYELLGVFQGFNSPGYPLGVEFSTFCRFSHNQSGEFLIDISLYDIKDEKLTDVSPRKLVFGELLTNDLITRWRVVFPMPGVYTFKIFCNNLNLSDFKIYCK